MFKIEFTLDNGATWQLDTDYPSFWQASKLARESSEKPGKITRVINVEQGIVLVAFKNGAPDSEHYNPRHY